MFFRGWSQGDPVHRGQLSEVEQRRRDYIAAQVEIGIPFDAKLVGYQDMSIGSILKHGQDRDHSPGYLPTELIVLASWGGERGPERHG